jgi:hypothetical protein
MKLAALALLCILLGSLVPLSADDGPTAEVVIGFAGGASWKDAANGTCVWFFPVLGDEELANLFTAPPNGAPVAHREHAYFLWVSDFSVVPLPSKAPFALALVPAGTATIYFRSDPGNRNFTDLADRSTWGIPIATFVRKASIIRSPDAFASDTFLFSADLTWSTPAAVNGKRIDLKTLIPKGTTCHEFRPARQLVGRGQLRREIEVIQLFQSHHERKSGPINPRIQISLAYRRSSAFIGGQSFPPHPTLKRRISSWDTSLLIPGASGAGYWPSIILCAPLVSM